MSSGRSSAAGPTHAFPLVASPPSYQTPPPTESMQYDVQRVTPLLHEATVRLPSTSPARWRWHRQFRSLSPQRRAQRAYAHQHNRLWARNSPTSEALRLPRAPRKLRPHSIAPTASGEHGNTRAHLHIAPLTSRYSVWVGRRCAILAPHGTNETCQRL